MVKHRQTLNPAKARHDAEALAAAARGPGEGRGARLRRRLTVALLGLLTVVLLSVAFAPTDAWFLAYVGLVPWLLALELAPTRRWALLCGWLSGLVFWAVSLYWLTWITLLGWGAGVAFLSLFWLVAAAVLRAAIRRGWPLWAVLPVVWVALEYLRGHVSDLYLGPSFPWFHLAHTQYAQARLIQIADVTGQYGVSFFVAAVNGLAADLLLGLLPGATGRAKLRRRMWIGGPAVAAMCAGLLLYGTWRLGQDTRTAGPIIGIVQEAFPISLAGREATAEEILDRHLQATARFFGQKVDLVIWPETMLPRGLNREVLAVDAGTLSGNDLRSLAGRFFGPDVWRSDLTDETIRAHLRPYIEGGVLPNGEAEPGRRLLAEKVRHLAGRLGCPILAGGATVHRDGEPISPRDLWGTRNGAIWFSPDAGAASQPVYAKRHLVPFSESVPFKRSWTGLYKLLRRCVPEAMEQIDPGLEWTRFVLKRPGGQWRLVSPICYEGTFADVCRAMVYDGGKRADILANLSNDGWFVYKRSGSYRGSTEHAQHLSHYCFRAVELRVPVVRAVNTGISASIDSCGRLVAEVHHERRRTMVPGTLLLDGARRNDVEYLPGHGPKVLVDSRVSWYSRRGNVFALVVGAAAAALAVWLAWKRPSRQEGVTS